MQRKFWIRLTVFILVFVILFGALEFFARLIYLPRSDMFLKKQSLENVKNDAKYLFLGNSHIEKGIDPSVFKSKAFNLAYSNQDLYNDMKLLTRYIDKLPELQCIVEGLSLHSFGWDESSNSMYYVKDYFFEYGIYPRHGFDFMFFTSSSVFWLHRTTIVQDYLGLHKSPSVYKFIDCFSGPDSISSGEWLLSSGMRYSVSKMDRVGLMAHGKETASREIFYYKKEIVRKQTGYLCHMAEISKKKGKKFVVVVMPVSVYYRQNLDNTIINSFYSALDLFHKKHPDVPILNFLDYFDQKESFYYNGDHLNAKGAKFLSKQLSSFLEK